MHCSILASPLLTAIWASLLPPLHLLLPPLNLLEEKRCSIMYTVLFSPILMEARAVPSPRIPAFPPWLPQHSSCPWSLAHACLEMLQTIWTSSESRVTSDDQDRNTAIYQIRRKEGQWDDVLMHIQKQTTRSSPLLEHQRNRQIHTRTHTCRQAGMQAGMQMQTSMHAQQHKSLTLNSVPTSRRSSEDDRVLLTSAGPKKRTRQDTKRGILKIQFHFEMMTVRSGMKRLFTRTNSCLSSILWSLRSLHMPRALPRCGIHCSVSFSSPTLSVARKSRTHKSSPNLSRFYPLVCLFPCPSSFPPAPSTSLSPTTPLLFVEICPSLLNSFATPPTDTQCPSLLESFATTTTFHIKTTER